MYKVSEISELLGVSKVTIYKKIDSLKKELRPHIKLKQKIKYIDNEGIEIIKNSLAINKQTVNKLNDRLTQDELTQDNSIYIEELTELKKEYIQELKSQIGYLKKELESKDKIISTTNELLRNSQVLLKQEKETKLLMHEQLKEEILNKQQEQIQAENEKLLSYIAATREENTKKSFWEKLFGK